VPSISHYIIIGTVSICSLTALASGPTSAYALGLKPERLSDESRVDCNSLLDKSAALRGTLFAMLVDTQNQLLQADKIHKALESDVADEAIEHLAHQEKRLEAILRDLDEYHCPPEHPTPPGPALH